MVLCKGDGVLTVSEPRGAVHADVRVPHVTVAVSAVVGKAILFCR